MSRCWSLFVLLIFALILSSCEKKEPAQSKPETSPPSLAHMEDTPEGHPASHPDLHPTSQPASQPNSSTDTQSPSQPAAQLLPISGKVAIEGLEFSIPEGWVQQTPQGQMRLAQYQLPGDAGPAELVFFSSRSMGGGGSAEQNIQRWISQFSNADNPSEPPEHKVEKLEVNGLNITVVKVTGTYTATAMGPMMPAKPPVANHSLYALIIQGSPKGDVHIKTTGPKATIDAQAAALETFTVSTKPAP